MLQIREVTYKIGDRLILNRVSFSLVAGDKVALVGPNGSGKTTLARIIMNEIVPDSGQVHRPKLTSYLPQEVADHGFVGATTTVLEFMMEGRGLATLKRRMEKTIKAMGQKLTKAKLNSVLADYGDAQEEFTRRGGYESEAEASQILNGIGLHLDPDRRVSTLSGGEKSRLAFARVLYSPGDLLILDEPTNHVDQEYYQWLAFFLRDIKSSVLVISHQADFINLFAERVVEINGITGQVTEYTGTLSDARRQRESLHQRLRQEAKLLEQEIDRLRSTAQRFRAKANKAAQAQSMFRRAQEMDTRLQDLKTQLRTDRQRDWRFALPEGPRASRIVLRVENLAKSFASLLFRNLSFTLERGQRLLIAGPNGAGKTTLLKIIADKEIPDAGTVHSGEGVRLGYYAQEHEGLDPGLTVLEEAQRACALPVTNLRGILGRFLFSQDRVFQRVGTLSQGEKSRLALCKLLLTQPNLLLLDEPTNHLDQTSRQAVAAAVNDFTGALILVSHDWEFIEALGIETGLQMPSGEYQLLSRLRQ